MHKVKLLSAALLTAATAHGRVTSTTQRDEGDSCIRAPRVGAFATEPWTDAAPCEPNTGY
jgi:hypothetical protein